MSSREVIGSLSWWQCWSFWQFKCSRTTMLKIWPECFDDLFGMWNESYGCHLVVMSARLLLCSMQVLAALPHLQNVMDLGHSVQCSFIRFFLQCKAVFSFCSIQPHTIVCRNSVIGLSKLACYGSFPKHVPSGSELSPANIISPKWKTGLQFKAVWYNRE